mmetsp:Transcript_13758/g.30857  ORF Transcript_13758/g.30857 Transcript_13758/m.30857 type:complete len:224 (-) Transcript_13758:653-1324(-)
MRPHHTPANSVNISIRYCQSLIIRRAPCPTIILQEGLQPPLLSIQPLAVIEDVQEQLLPVDVGRQDVVVDSNAPRQRHEGSPPVLQRRLLDSRRLLWQYLPPPHILRDPTEQRSRHGHEVGVWPVKGIARAPELAPKQVFCWQHAQVSHKTGNAQQTIVVNHGNKLVPDWQIEDMLRYLQSMLGLHTTELVLTIPIDDLGQVVGTHMHSYVAESLHLRLEVIT